MRILHTEASCGWGGQEIRILSEARGLIRRGHVVELACPGHSRIFSEAARFGVKAHAVDIGKKNLFSLVKTRQFLKRNEYDVINCHSSTDTWLVAVAQKALKVATPIVRTRHISAPIPNNWTSRWLYKTATSHIVATGEALRQQLAKDLSLPLTNITSVPTGIDTSHFVPVSATERDRLRQNLGLPAGKPLIGIVATLRSWKGHQYLIKSLAEYMPADTTLLIVGDGPQRESIQDLVRSLKLDDRVIMAGNQVDVLPWMQALDIFVLPSYANEGVPQALIQAMACGLPCVSTPIGAITEIAIDQATALIVPPKDISGIGQAMLKLLNDEPLKRRLGTEARQHIMNNYSENRMLDYMERIFSTVI